MRTSDRKHAIPAVILLGLHIIGVLILISWFPPSILIGLMIAAMAVPDALLIWHLLSPKKRVTLPRAALLLLVLYWGVCFLLMAQSTIFVVHTLSALIVSLVAYAELRMGKKKYAPALCVVEAAVRLLADLFLFLLISAFADESEADSLFFSRGVPFSLWDTLSWITLFIIIRHDLISEVKPMNLKNVYFVIGTSYAGKSTLVRNIAAKRGGIELGENYHDARLPELDSREFPNLTYTRDLKDWHEFIRRTPDEYVTWLTNVKKECETVELQILAELLEKPETKNREIFVDTNISIETLRRLTDEKHVLVMLADPEIAIHRFFDRPDPEKQFLYRLMLEEPDPQAALDNYREILTRVCSKERYDELLHAGFPVIFRDENRTEAETVRMAEEIWGI
ncbi:MAG: hypothetical protein IKP40_12740 [Clostridia bacterium]|nr:hypothetical protein [Clostridia bacterium]